MDTQTSTRTDDEERALARLVNRAQAGDRDAFGELTNRYQGLVWATARRWQSDHHEAAELVQEVFLHALRKIPQLREPACIGAWLQRITVRLALNRKTRRPPLATVGPEQMEQRRDSGDGPLDSVLDRERRDLVREAVASLRPMDRDVLVAFYLNGRSLAWIAEEFEVPLGTVKRRLHVARGRLESVLRTTSTLADHAADDQEVDDDAPERLEPRLPRDGTRRRDEVGAPVAVAVAS
ncbi:ECF RNA polymerase sigma factor SigW [Planctomycetes bacterium Pan216]|uniref:ECF RNA polymerase sigma factor SigW n=1 Tax=Kolteria novifilia TaxID=2527975 RepID=A0A518BBR9_9BACT|nr:ECF RNA polymerase sigma factor SigW [Planctomycetes bacterium Pan216]